MNKLYRIYKRNHIFRNIVLISISFCILLAGLLVIWLSSLRIPDFHSFDDRKIINSTKIYDRTGEVLLYDIHEDVKRTDVSFADTSINIKNATVAIEDSDFYNHNGIRLSSIARAVLSNFLGTGIPQGGSTITQQLVKNTLLTTSSGFGKYVRKIKEWILAIKIDNSMPKEKILEAYLNESPYGGTIYGIEEASKTYLGKKASDLSIAEAAYLASIPQSPTVLSPYGKNLDKLEARKNLVLSRMLELKFITQEDYDQAKSEVVTFVPQSNNSIKAPHFVFFVKDYIKNKYGSEMVEKRGLKVITTLNYELQVKGEQIVKDGALQNEKDWNGKNAGLVAIDPKTGQILTMVGSRDYFDKEIDGNFNIATAFRQPGSSFKPFIYATAFNKGFTPSTVLFDLPTEFQTTCDAQGKANPGRNQSDCYMPDNYDGKFRGPLSLRDALAQSINVPAVKLLYLVGVPDAINTAESMGINTLTDSSRYGLTLVIGGGEVSLLDMSSAYSVFANNGVRNAPTGILRVEDASGKVLEEFKESPQEILPKNTALTISDILSDEKSRIPTFGSHSVLYIPNRAVAVKTGTTNSNRDAWTIGYTPSIAVGVWAGNNENTPMKKGGSALAGPIWNKFISEALKELPNETFEEPDLSVDPQTVKPILRGHWQGNENFFIDKISGKLATEFTPTETLEEKVITNVHSILYWVNRKDILGQPPINPSSDSQFSHWEAPIQNWWAQNKWNYKVVLPSEKPTEVDDVHTGETKPSITIVEPNNKTVYAYNQKIYLRISSISPTPIKKVDVFVNNIYLGTSNSISNFSFMPSEIENLREENEIRVISYDATFNKGEAFSEFKVKK